MNKATNAPIPTKMVKEIRKTLTLLLRDVTRRATFRGIANNAVSALKASNDRVVFKNFFRGDGIEACAINEDITDENQSVRQQSNGSYHSCGFKDGLTVADPTGFLILLF